MADFCKRFCGLCKECEEAMAEEDRIEAIFASLSDEDRDSLFERDEDDPDTFAVDHKGRP